MESVACLFWSNVVLKYRYSVWGRSFRHARAFFWKCILVRFGSRNMCADFNAVPVVRATFLRISIYVLRFSVLWDAGIPRARVYNFENNELKKKTDKTSLP